MKNIEFISSVPDIIDVIEPPKPSKNFLPDWYKKSSSYIDKTQKIPVFGKNSGSNHTFKKCIPILDSMSSGYMFGSPCDIYAIDPEENDGTRLSWGRFPFEPLANNHPREQLEYYPAPHGYYGKMAFKWNFWWRIKTPPGYSCLFTHPFHRNDLPFQSLTGIVDTDVYETPILFPFFMREDFYGKIDKGTPVIQIIPFKRDSWKMKDRGFSEKVMKDSSRFFSYIGDTYKKMFWQKKDYS